MVTRLYFMMLVDACDYQIKDETIIFLEKLILKKGKK